MATRGYFGIQTDNGSILSIYNHFDSDDAGEILRTHYNSKQAATNLIAMGDCSKLRENLETSVFYKRDRNEAGCHPDSDPDLATYLELLEDVPYLYLFSEGSWKVYEKINGKVCCKTL